MSPPAAGAGRFPIVGIGASAGGLEACTALLKALPPDLDMAFVVVQHLDPNHQSMLAPLLAKATKMPIFEVEDGAVVRPNCVYVIPPNKTMAIEDGVLQLRPQSGSGRQSTVDQFFRSLAADQKSFAVGIILSGVATDGTLGLEAIKAEGGVTFAQDLRSAKYGGMPRSARESGHVDFVLPPEQIAKKLTTLDHQRLLPEESSEADGDFRRILQQVRSATGVDFSLYKPSTIHRRIARRMVLKNVSGIENYVRHLAQDPVEVRDLYEDILIHVTGFFRESEVFQALRQIVLPKLVAKRPRNLPIRIWTPGCSSGEEIYSINMVVQEYLQQRRISLPIQLFGTDISEVALNKARAGIYAESAMMGVSPERRKRFFTKVEGGYQISKTVREQCIFSRHDLGKDPPFSQLDLISCRNVLIYLGPELQKRALSVFHYALKADGFLLLGKSETLSAYAHLFGLKDRKSKLYVRKQVPTPQVQGVFSREIGHAPVPSPHREASRIPDLGKRLERIIAERYLPASIAVDQDLQIVHLQGDLSPYLKPASGTPSFHIQRMIRDDLVIQIRSAIHRIRKEGGPVRREGIRLQHEGDTREISVEVLEIDGPRSTAQNYLIVFDDVRRSSPHPPPKRKSDAREKKKEASPDAESDSLREYLRSVIEESEIKTEELRAANEEILSSNEELQSTNEELETAKEELQSTNEELVTLNEELQNRNAELANIANDLNNLLVGVNIPVLILDHSRRIRRFTPPAEKLLNLISADVGRPVSDIRPNLDLPELDKWIASVADDMQTIEKEVQDRDGRWHSLRMRPYKTADHKIDGVLISLMDIDRLKVADLESARLAALVRSSSDAIITYGNDGLIDMVNPTAARLYGYAPEEILGKQVNLLIPPEKLSEWQTAVRAVAHRSATEFETVRLRKDGSRVQVSIGLSSIQDRQGRVLGLAAIHRDISERIAHQERIRESEVKLRILAGQLIATQEEGSKTLAAELHDTFSQRLGALGMSLSVLDRKGSLPPALRQELKRARGEIQKLAGDLHQVARRLHPAVIEDLGLVPALQSECDTFSQLHGIAVTFQKDSISIPIPGEVSFCLYRVAQESLRNAAKHSKATRVRVTLRHRPPEIVLTLTDNGVGFDPAVERRKGTIGLLSMEERIRLVGGTISITSSPGRGTSVQVCIPMERKNS